MSGLHKVGAALIWENVDGLHMCTFIARTFTRQVEQTNTSCAIYCHCGSWSYSRKMDTNDEIVPNASSEIRSSPHMDKNFQKKTVEPGPKTDSNLAQSDELTPGTEHSTVADDCLPNNTDATQTTKQRSRGPSSLANCILFRFSKACCSVDIIE